MQVLDEKLASEGKKFELSKKELQLRSFIMGLCSVQTA